MFIDVIEKENYEEDRKELWKWILKSNGLDKVNFTNVHYDDGEPCYIVEITSDNETRTIELLWCGGLELIQSLTKGNFHEYLKEEAKEQLKHT